MRNARLSELKPMNGHSAVSGLADRLAFARGFIANPKQVSSVVPSSAFLERRLLRTADLARARTVVELGPGTGGTTRAMLRAMPADARLLAVELNPVFRTRLVDRVPDPRLLVPAGGAEQLAELLQAARLPAPEVVLSGIPFSALPRAAAQRTAQAIADCLAPGGRFVAYQLRRNVADWVAPHLGPPAVAWEWLNVPPLRVFCWVKPRSHAKRPGKSIPENRCTHEP